MDKKDDIRGRYFQKYGIISLLIFEIIAFVVVGFFMGKYLDQKIGTQNFFLAFGVIGGFTVGIYKFYVDVRKFLK